jgi:succinoglycan biosynthesis protein ExoA
VDSGAPLRADALVVIPCLNEKSHIARVIGSVLRDPAAETFLIVVADGGSTDGTREAVSQIAEETPNVRLVDNPARIQSAGVNRAARLFGEGRRWLVRVDAHADYPDGYVSKLMSEAERTHATAVVVAMKARGTSCFQRAAATAQNSFLGAGGSPHRRKGKEGFVDHGHHALIDLEKFSDLGGYDETQSHNEDAEFDLRLVRAGGRIWLTREAEVIYFPRARARELYAQYRNYGRGRATTLLRHHSKPKLRQIIPAALAPLLIVALAAPLFPPAAVPAGLWLAACGVLGLVLGFRERTRCAFAACWAAPIIHVAWSIGFWSAVLETAAANLRAPGRPARAGA